MARTSCWESAPLTRNSARSELSSSRVPQVELGLGGAGGLHRAVLEEGAGLVALVEDLLGEDKVLGQVEVGRGFVGPVKSESAEGHVRQAVDLDQGLALGVEDEEAQSAPGDGKDVLHPGVGQALVRVPGGVLRVCDEIHQRYGGFRGGVQSVDLVLGGPERGIEPDLVSLGEGSPGNGSVDSSAGDVHAQLALVQNLAEPGNCCGGCGRRGDSPWNTLSIGELEDAVDAACTGLRHSSPTGWPDQVEPQTG
ncbi:hypothetical protein OJ252_3546 [Cryptosporidium canis]|uniref:Uncharacterized protein n=1 Tax=Cryptosporidium canis TaxID=195482 RepID=A0ABQ8P207_9CRYT|nr:hypothetical protein OJ252_3546 [Cryptosporidium canis]